MKVSLHIQLSIELTNTPDTRKSENTKRVESELKTKQMVDMIPFLKASITSVLGELCGKGSGDNELHAESDRIYDQVLKDAASLCNEKTNLRATRLKENVNA